MTLPSMRISPEVIVSSPAVRCLRTVEPLAADRGLDVVEDDALREGMPLAPVRRLARDLGPRGITITNVQPGPVDTDMNPATGDFAESLIPLMAIGRYGHAEEIASFVAYLAGPETGYITGASLTIDGGFGA